MPSWPLWKGLFIHLTGSHLPGNVQFFTKYPYPPHTPIGCYWKFRRGGGGGGSMANIFKGKLNWKFLGDGRVQTKEPCILEGGMEILESDSRVTYWLQSKPRSSDPQTWHWRWLPLRLSTHQSPWTVLSFQDLSHPADQLYKLLTEWRYLVKHTDGLVYVEG